jgi:hypothetical protein
MMACGRLLLLHLQSCCRRAVSEIRLGAPRRVHLYKRASHSEASCGLAGAQRLVPYSGYLPLCRVS